MACLGTESAIAVDDALGCVQCTRGDEVDDADGKRDDDAASVPLDSSAPKDLANRDAKAAAPAATAATAHPSPPAAAGASPTSAATREARLPRAEHLALALFRRQLATGLLLTKHKEPGSKVTQACVMYTSPDFQTLWWFESLMAGQKTVVAFDDITEVGAGPPAGTDTVAKALLKFKRKPDAEAADGPAKSKAHEWHLLGGDDAAKPETHLEDVAEQRQLHIVTRGGLVLHLSTFSDEQRAHVIHGFRLCAMLTATQPGSGHEGGPRSLADAADLFGIELSADDADDADEAARTAKGLRQVDVTPGASCHDLGHIGQKGGGAGSLFGHIARHHCRLYREEFHPNYHHEYGIPAGTTVELNFSEKYALALPTADELPMVQGAEQTVADAGDADVDAVEVDAAAEQDDGKHHELGGADVLGKHTLAGANVATDYFKPGMFVLGEVVSHDDDSDTYVIAYRKGPFDSDVLRDALFAYEDQHAHFPEGTEFLDVRRENLVVDYNEQHAAHTPLFVFGISVVQVLVGLIYVYGIRKGKAYEEFGDVSPICGPEWMWYKVVGDWPRCHDQRGQVWRLWTYQYVHSGYMHLTGNVITQCFFGIPIEMVHGPLVMMAIYWVGVVTGALTCAMFDPYSNVVGASGGVYTLTGVHIANLVLNWADMQKGITGNHWTRLFLLLLFFGYEAVVYVASPTENLSYSAHLGGALAGVVFGLAVLHNFDFENKCSHYLQKGAAIVFFAYFVLAVTWYCTHFPPAYLISSVHGISNEPCCYQSRKCARWLPKNARDNLFRCQSGYELKYRDPIDGSAWLAGTVYTECSDLQGICEENYPNATWCSGAK